MSSYDFLQLYLGVSLKAALLLLLACGWHWLGPKASAATKHLWWTVALCACVSLPLLTTILPAWRVSLPIAMFPVPAAKTHATTPVSFIESKYAPHWESMPETLSVEAPPAIKSSARINWAAWLMVLWALGAWLVLARIFVGFFSIGLLKRRAQSLEHETWRTLVVEAASALRLKSRVQLRLSEQISVPMTTGVFRPSVLLPVAALHWSQEQLRSVLRHELAHVKRRDCLTQMVAHLTCALYWCNPLVWIAARQMRKLREQACDDDVLATGTRASDYASCLVNVAKSAEAGNYASPVAVGMACSPLGERITAILNPTLNRRKLTRRVVMWLILFISSLIMPLAALQPVSQAASAPAPAAVAQEQEAKKQQREAETHLREIEKHRREITDVHQREIEKHLRELEKLHGLSDAQKARLEAEVNRAAAVNEAASREMEARIRALVEKEIATQQQAITAEQRQLAALELERQVQEQIAQVMRAQRSSEELANGKATLLEKRAQLAAELERLQQTYTDKHPAVIEQQAQVRALTERLQQLEQESPTPPMTQGQAQLELKLAALQTQLKILEGQYTNKHPKVLEAKAQLEALLRELERNLRK